MKDSMGFEAALAGKYMRSLPSSFGRPRLRKPSRFLIVFRQKAALIFSRDVGTSAMKDRVEFDAPLLGKYRRPLPSRLRVARD